MLDEKDYRMVARRREEAKQQLVLDETAKRNQEILEGADPDPNVGTGFYGDSEEIKTDLSEEVVKPVIKLVAKGHGVSPVRQPKTVRALDNPSVVKTVKTTRSAKSAKAAKQAKFNKQAEDKAVAESEAPAGGISSTFSSWGDQAK